jgi:hypothetical protein
VTEDQPAREGDVPAPAPLEPAGEIEIRMVVPLAGVHNDGEGGDPVCWAHLVCDECGAVTTEGHRAGCSGRGT